MTTGELWVEHPLFPWLMTVLAWWILCSTAVMVRNWVRLRKLERHNKLLIEKIDNLDRQYQSIRREEECSSELYLGKAEIRIAEEPAAIEETDEDRDNVPTSECENQERERVGTT